MNKNEILTRINDIFRASCGKIDIRQFSSQYWLCENKNKSICVSDGCFKQSVSSCPKYIMAAILYEIGNDDDRETVSKDVPLQLLGKLKNMLNS